MSTREELIEQAKRIIMRVSTRPYLQALAEAELALEQRDRISELETRIEQLESRENK